MDETQEFSKTAKFHFDKYPLMQPEDMLVLAFQNEFGKSEHAKNTDNEDLQYLESIPSDIQFSEPLGNGLSRAFTASENISPLIGKMVEVTERSYSGNMMSLNKKLDSISDIMDTSQALEKFEKSKREYPMHSRNYSLAYRTDYVVIRKDFVHFYPLLCSIGMMLKAKKNVLISIDGNCCSGKTHLAGLISDIFPCNIFHTDDYYLPASDRKQNWKDIPASNIELDRIRKEIILPASASHDIITRRFDCQTQTYAEERKVKGSRLTIIEGSYSSHPLLSHFYDLKIFLRCSPEKQAERVKKRNENGFSEYFDCWIPLENRYFDDCSVEKNSFIIVDTTSIF